MATVVLIHGLFGAFGDERTWSRLRPHRVVVPDLLGYGHEVDNVRPITMQSQVEYVREALNNEPVHLIGHSVGGVIATLYAHQYPHDTLSLINVEGNFTLADAFWSAELAKMPSEQAAALLDEYRADPAAWFGATTDSYEIQSARDMLAFQPASTLQATAASVVATTGDSGWDSVVRQVFDRVPVHLIAGEHSRAEWNIPDWALNAAASYTALDGVGHAMMFQNPEKFGDALAALV